MDEMLNKLLDHYRISSVLGRGGMGVVYKALDENLHRDVALKMMKPSLARDEKFIKRFDKEARSQAALQHPNIVRIYAFRKLGDHAFIVMELIDGKSMADLVNKISPKPWPKVLDLFKQCLRGIDCAHQNGVIHRDIKPRNILVSNQNEIKIGDFGLAKLKNSGHTTFSENTAGTLRYMSPEQIQGSRELDHRSDIYSLGITFYEVLAGELPFAKGANEYYLFKQIVEEKMPDPVRINAEIPTELSRILLKATEKDPSNRYQHAQEMLSDIEAFEKSQEGNETVVIQPSQFREKEKKSPLPLLLGLIALVAAAGAAWYFMGGNATSKPYLSVTTSPQQVEIYQRGNLIGTTPVENFPLELIGKRITFQAEGYQTIDTLISGEILSKGSFHLFLDPTQQAIAPGKLRIGGTSNAVISINGERRGNSPLLLSDLAPGDYDIRIEKSGYETEQHRISVSSGNESSFTASLKRIPKTATPQKTDNSQRLASNAENAKRLSDLARKRAADAGASVQSVFANARRKEREALQALRQEKFSSATRLFADAQSLFEQAEENHRIQQNQRSASLEKENDGVSRQRTVSLDHKRNAEQARTSAGAQLAFLKVYKEAEEKLSEGNRNLDSGNFGAANTAFQESATLFKQANKVYQAQEKAILTQIEAYRKALENKDLKRMKALFPDMDRKSEDSWKDFFGFANNLTVTMDIGNIRHSQNEADAIAKTQIRFEGGGENAPVNNWRMHFRQVADQWVISKVQQN